MSYDIYGLIGNGLKRMAVPSGTRVPQTQEPSKWKKLGSFTELPQDLADEVANNGFGRFEQKITVEVDLSKVSSSPTKARRDPPMKR